LALAGASSWSRSDEIAFSFFFLVSYVLGSVSLAEYFRNMNKWLHEDLIHKIMKKKLIVSCVRMLNMSKRERERLSSVLVLDS